MIIVDQWLDNIFPSPQTALVNTRTLAGHKLLKVPDSPGLTCLGMRPLPSGFGLSEHVLTEVYLLIKKVLD